MSETHSISRRQFLATTATALAIPTFIPASALGRDGRPAPSERINMACFGFGTIAFSTVKGFLNDERVQVVAIADVNKESGHYGYSGQKQAGREVGRRLVEEHYASQAGNTGYQGCKTYNDFRELLDKEDVDAVNVSTPDHWHAVMAIYCARKGKHVYGQKPLSVTIEEGRRMSDEVKKAGITWQTGSQQRSEIYFRQACEFVRNGRLGKLKPIQVGIPGGHPDFNQMASRLAPEPVPANLDYDLWEGPAPHRDYRPALLPLNWRNNFDYSGGMITDWGAHHIDIVQCALGMDNSGPVLLENIQGKLPAPDAIYNISPSFRFDCVYSDGTRMTVADNTQITQGVQFEGEEGRSIQVKRGSISTQPVDLRREKIRDNEIHLYKSHNHTRNFVDCIYTGNPTAAPIEAAHRTITISHLANIALRLGRKSLRWDPLKERVIGDEAANQMISRPMRHPWSLA